MIGLASAEKAKILGMSFVTAYVDDFEKALTFYMDVLGLEKALQPEKDACFFKIGENPYGLFLRGGVHGRNTKPDGAHTSFVLMVESTTALIQRLRLNGAKVVQEEPVDMGEGDFWFQFVDPAGNVLEALGGK